MTDIQRKPHFAKKKYDGGSTVTYEGESDPCIGDRVGDNGNVQYDLNCQMRHDSGRQKCTGKVSAVHGDDAEPP